MCTIVALRHVRSDYPLVLATNRDEFFARSSAGAGRLLETPRTVGGRDLVARGTWMGVTQAGLFVGVTNQRTYEGADPTKRSRGELVLSALSLGDVAAVTRHVEALDGRAYNPFNLMWGDAHALYVGYARADRREIQIEPVPPGLHVLPNDRLDSPSFAKVARARALIAPHVEAPIDVLIDALKRALADRQLPELDALPDPPPGARHSRALLRELAALCVRTPLYGTRSSSIVAIGAGGVARYLYADGPPDQATFEDVTGHYR